MKEQPAAKDPWQPPRDFVAGLDALRWDEWLSLFANRDEVAQEYADTLRMTGVDWGGWRSFNAAILRRWSPAGLRYIKEKAWRLART